jgi:quinol monooxygenase YgiN
VAGVVHIPWYGSFFRGDKLADAVCEVAAVSLRYGATQYAVHRSRDDQYRILQMAWFASRADWEHYWEGPEMAAMRTRCSGWYQVPVLYVWQDELVADVVALADSAA